MQFLVVRAEVPTFTIFKYLANLGLVRPLIRCRGCEKEIHKPMHACRWRLWLIGQPLFTANRMMQSGCRFQPNAILRTRNKKRSNCAWRRNRFGNNSTCSNLRTSSRIRNGRNHLLQGATLRRLNEQQSITRHPVPYLGNIFQSRRPALHKIEPESDVDCEPHLRVIVRAKQEADRPLRHILRPTRRKLGYLRSRQYKSAKRPRITSDAIRRIIPHGSFQIEPRGWEQPGIVNRPVKQRLNCAHRYFASPGYSLFSPCQHS